MKSKGNEVEIFCLGGGYLYFVFSLFKTEIQERITKEIKVDFISKNEIELASTHTRLFLQIINRIFKKMSANIKIPAIKVFQFCKTIAC